ncbi:hypothetical protein BGZ65_002776 [Modicella reniformis]|uniref:Protein YTP1-like C-terminal domain-containing protein n=1 Tax=Modicella reniformis TaxID=1440133 RepID=A0A9P6LSV2_9FUNG|nr:hypothetical protein BGZ65_002776 [Modicella reniformis]
MGIYRKFTKNKPRLQLSWLSNAVPRHIHSFLGKAHLLLAYIQIMLGIIQLVEACPGQAFGQCIAHIIMDLQHTSLGLLWVGGGVLSLFLESKYSPLARFIIRKTPLLVILTGYAMGQHSQCYMFVTTAHTFFGYSLILGGVCRLIQLALRPAVSSNTSTFSTNRNSDEDDATLEEDMDLQDRNKAQQQHLGGPNGQHNDPLSGLARGETPISAFFGFLSAFGVISAGLLFQSAHEEQLNIVMYYLSDPSTYINWVMTLAFFSVTFMLILTQVGKKNIGEENGGVNKPAYNRVRTRVHSEDRDRIVSRHEDIEMSGYLAVDE